MPQRDEHVPPGIVALGRFLEICVYAPLGAGVKLLDDAPGAVARARQELSNARFIGRMVVSQGESQLRERMAGTQSSVTVTDPSDGAAAAGSSVDSVESPASEEVRAVVVSSEVDVELDVEERDEGLVAEQPDDELALPDYDHLPAIDIIDQLESLTVEELDGVERYERANRRRRTVLGKIAQLRDAS